MAGSETYWDPNTKSWSTRETKTGADVAQSEATAAAQDASKIGAKKTGRGMRPGETVPAWKARLAAEDSAADSPQKKAIKGMIDTKSEEAPK